MPSLINRLDNGTVEITLTIPWPDIAAASEKQVLLAVSQTELPGFRKGRAPRSLVEPKLDKNRTLSAALQQLIPSHYSQAVDEHHLKPVLYPSIKIQKGEQNQDWILVAATCEAPSVTLPSPLKPPKQTKELNGLINWLAANSAISLPDLIVETEANRRLAALAENLSRLGLSIDKYLETKKTTLENIRAEMSVSSRSDLAAEFVLQQVQIDHQLENRAKTLDFLSSLV